MEPTDFGLPELRHSISQSERCSKPPWEEVLCGTLSTPIAPHQTVRVDPPPRRLHLPRISGSPVIDIPPPIRQARFPVIVPIRSSSQDGYRISSLSPGQNSPLHDATTTLAGQYWTPYSSTTMLPAPSVGVSSVHVFHGNAYGS